MSQVWLVPVLAGDKQSSAFLSKVNGALEALRTLHSGAAGPSVTVAYMVYQDTDDYVIRQRDAADSSWQDILASNVKNHQDEPQVYIAGGLSASINIPLYSPGQAWYADELVVLCDTTTSTSDGSNNWQFDVQNITQANGLFATPPTTNGNEITAQTTWKNSFDQNQSLVADDYLELQITKTGAPTSLASAQLVVGIRGRLIGA